MNRMNKTHFLTQDELAKTQVNIDEESYQILSSEELEKLGIRREKERLQWLVAVGPGGMILAEQVFSKRMIDSKEAIGVMTSMDLAQMEVEAAYVEWYTAKPMAKARYRTMRREYPEDVYVTLAELGEEQFTKVMM